MGYSILEWICQQEGWLFLNIIIVGNGKVGYTLAQHLSTEEHNVTIIDTNDEALKRAEESLDVMTIKGNGAAISTLREAGTGQADVLIAATDMDETNMVCCLSAKTLGCKYTIARVRNVEYTADVNALKHEMGIDLLINPEKATATEVARLLRFPSAANIETFYRGRVELMSFRAREEDFFVGKPLAELSKQVRNLPILFCAAERGEEVIIPNGAFVPQVGDKLYVIGAPLGVHEFFKLIGRYSSHIKTVMILGGGRITLYLAQALQRMNVRVKIIEQNPARCLRLAEHLPHAVIIQGDGTDQELLESENLTDADAFVALTGRDEDNLIISFYAMQQKLSKVVAKCNRQNYALIAKDMGLESVISPKLFTANVILQAVRGMQNSKGSVMNTLYKIADNGAEAMEFVVGPSTRHLGIPLKDLKLKKGVLVAVIVHNGATVIPLGTTTISLGDTVIIVSKDQAILDVNDIFDESRIDREGEA